jgi:formimidoylglutamate deiminase
MPILTRAQDGTLRLPALATAHSHAFQRALRGRAQRPIVPAADDFWTWRSAMYELAASLTPESIHAISLVAFRELARAGVRTVGEFHYVHHQPDGTPYDDRTLLADAVILAAREAKLRIALLRVAYHRAGPGRAPEPGQRRFCDPTVDDVLRDVDTLRARHAADADVVVGLAPHSVRAVPPAWLAPLSEYAASCKMPLHMHVAEQVREVDECVAETGRRPVELLADNGVLSERFVAVHATNLAPNEAQLLGAAKAFACICPTTERDLGDGLGDLAGLASAGVRLCTGVDSYVLVDPIEDLRALETHERLRTRTRMTRVTGAWQARDPAGASQASTGSPAPAEQLWRAGSIEGAAACGFGASEGAAGGHVVIREDHPSLELVPPALLLDAIVFGSGCAIIDRVEPA